MDEGQGQDDTKRHYNFENVLVNYCKSIIFSEFSVFDLNPKLKGR